MLSDIRNISGPSGGMVPALNQGKDPWCWAFSPDDLRPHWRRASAGSPYKHLSGNAVGNMVTGFKVRGGWSENAMKFVQEKGVPETSYWPEGDNKRHWDSPDTWANAAENVVLEWWDIDPGDICCDHDLPVTQLPGGCRCPSVGPQRVPDRSR
jgi:hypothetical protein